jgi:ferredoxin
MHIRILRERCCGNAECVEMAPGVFALDSKNKAVLLDEGAAGAEDLQAAAEACPCGAILVENEEGTVLYP